MIPNKDPVRYGTAMKLGLIPIKGGTRSYVITSSFMVKGCGMCKLDIENNYGVR